jgi:hypothetical protein
MHGALDGGMRGLFSSDQAGRGRMPAFGTACLRAGASRDPIRLRPAAPAGRHTRALSSETGGGTTPTGLAPSGRWREPWAETQRGAGEGCPAPRRAVSVFQAHATTGVRVSCRFPGQSGPRPCRGRARRSRAGLGGCRHRRSGRGDRGGPGGWLPGEGKAAPAGFRLDFLQQVFSGRYVTVGLPIQSRNPLMVNETIQHSPDWPCDD